MKKLLTVVLILLLAVTIFIGCRLIYSYIQVKKAYDTYITITQDASERIESYLVDGEIAIEDLDHVLEEVHQYAKELYVCGDITNYSYQQGDSCVYMEIDGWLGMIYEVPVKDFLAGGTDGISIVTVEPYASDFDVWANYLMSGANGPDEAAELVERAFSKFSFSDDLEDTKVTVESVRNWPNHSIIIWVGHGTHSSREDNPDFAGSCIAVRDDTADPQTLVKYRREIASDAIYISSAGTLCLTPVFFDKHMPDDALKGNLVYISTCYSATDTKLAQSILNNGAIAFLGNTRETSQTYAFKMPYTFFKALTPDKDGGYIRSVNEALTYAKAKHGDADWRAGSQVEITTLYDFTLPEMIPLMGEVFDVSSDFSLSIYGENNTLYDNYTLYITQARALNDCYLNNGENVELDDIIANCMDYRIVAKAEPELFSLTPGIYELAIIDNADIEKTQIITIQVLGETGSNTLSFDTNFGSASTEKQNNTATSAAETVSPKREKLLTQVNVYVEDNLSETYTLQYNENGQLSGAVVTASPDTANFSYTYDKGGCLLKANRGLVRGKYGDTDEYVYNNSEQLISHKYYWGGGNIPYRQSDYEYDKQGNLISEICLNPNFDGSALETSLIYSYTYVYDDYGQVVEKQCYVDWIDSDFDMVTEYGEYLYSEYVAVTRYSYDSMGRVQSVCSADVPKTLCNPYGNPDLEWDDQTFYNYDYAPLVLEQSSNGKFVVQIRDSVGKIIWSQYLGDNSLNIDAEGYIIGSTDTYNEYRYELIYGKELNAD